VKDKLLVVWRWLRDNVFKKDMILWILVAEIIFWSPVIVFAVLALIITPYYWTACSAIILFWAGPFTPAVPLQLALAVGLRKVCGKKKKE